jgi:hypothetical protein
MGNEEISASAPLDRLAALLSAGWHCLTAVEATAKSPAPFIF